MDGIKVNKEKLIERIAAAGIAVVSGTKDDIFGAVLFRANGDVSVLANNYGTFVEAGSIGDEDHIAAIVHYRTLFDAVKSLGDVVSVRKTAKNLILESGKDRFQIKEVDGEIDSELPDGGEIVGSFYVDAGLWNDAVSRVSFAAGRDPDRIILSGINVRVDGDQAIVEATDGITAARAFVPVRSVMLGDPGRKIEFIYPAKTAVKISKIMRSSDPENNEMIVRVFSGRVDFAVGNVFAATSVIVENFPELDQVFPVKFSRKIVVDKKRFEIAVKRALLFGGESNYGDVSVRANGEVVVCSETVETGSTEDIIPAEIDPAEDFGISFGFDRLKKIVENVRGEKIAFECIGSGDPARVSGDEGDPFFAVLMPVITYNKP